jgi:hypothetical protein
MKGTIDKIKLEAARPIKHWPSLFFGNESGRANGLSGHARLRHRVSLAPVSQRPSVRCASRISKSLASGGHPLVSVAPGIQEIALEHLVIAKPKVSECEVSWR